MYKTVIEKPNGKLGVLLVGLGAVSTTFIAGVESIKKGQAKPFGSLTQMQTIRIGKRTEGKSPLIKDFVPLAKLDDLVFGAWDPIPDDAYTAALKAGVLEEELLKKVKTELIKIKPMSAVFDSKYVRNLSGSNIKKNKNKFELAGALIKDIKAFMKNSRCERAVMVWCGSTEIYVEQKDCHKSIKSFENAMERNAEEITPSMIYAYAAIKCGVPFANGSPNLTVDVPAIVELAKLHNVPIVGKDFKTGQTLMKTVLSPALKV